MLKLIRYMAARIRPFRAFSRTEHYAVSYRALYGLPRLEIAVKRVIRLYWIRENSEALD